MTSFILELLGQLVLCCTLNEFVEEVLEKILDYPKLLVLKIKRFIIIRTLLKVMKSEEQPINSQSL